ncbi:MAG: M12 family metallo-peptidase [Pseudomonadota bacterium]
MPCRQDFPFLIGTLLVGVVASLLSNAGAQTNAPTYTIQFPGGQTSDPSKNAHQNFGTATLSQPYESHGGQITGTQATGQASTKRVIKILALTDESFRHTYKTEEDEGCPELWEDAARMILEDASAVFEGEFRIRFELLRVLPHFTVAPMETNALLAKIKKDFPDSRLNSLGADMVVLFSWQDASSPHQYGRIVSKIETDATYAAGASAPFSRYAVVNSPTFDQTAHILAHEMGHIFGAVHVADPGSVMCGIRLASKQNPCDSEAKSFDEANAEIVRMTAPKLDFRMGDRSFDKETRSHYSELVARTGSGKANFLTNRYIEEADAALEAKDFESAEKLFAQAVAENPADSYSRLSLCLARAELANSYIKQHDYKTARLYLSLARDPKADSTCKELVDSTEALLELDSH